MGKTLEKHGKHMGNIWDMPYIYINRSSNGANYLDDHPTVLVFVVNNTPLNQWEFQDPIEDGGTDSIQKAYFLGLCKGISPENMTKNMVQYSASILGSCFIPID